jgi:hypothetical protein
VLKVSVGHRTMICVHNKLKNLLTWQGYPRQAGCHQEEFHYSTRVGQDMLTREWLSDRLFVQEGLSLSGDSGGVDKSPKLRNGLTEGNISFTCKQIVVPKAPLNFSISVFSLKFTSGSNKWVSTVSSYSFYYKLVVIQEISLLSHCEGSKAGF